MVRAVLINTVIHGDCLEVMTQIPDGSVDMILCDLPYGTTACSWDSIIPFESLWSHYERVIKENGAIVLTASQPFTTALISSNLRLFRYELIWEKSLATNFMLTNKQPSKKHENICVFYKKQPLYIPQMEPGRPYSDKARKRTVGVHGNAETVKKPIQNNGTRHPSSVLYFSHGNNDNEHPTQKPVSLFRWLIESFTNEGDIVLDNCMGSGTTAIASLSCGRRFIGIEKESKYVEVARRRIENVQPVMNF